MIQRAEKMVEVLKEIRQRLFLNMVSKLIQGDPSNRELLQKEITKALIVFQKDCGVPASDWIESEKIIAEYIRSVRSDLFIPKQSQGLTFRFS